MRQAAFNEIIFVLWEHLTLFQTNLMIFQNGSVINYKTGKNGKFKKKFHYN